MRNTCCTLMLHLNIESINYAVEKKSDLSSKSTIASSSVYDFITTTDIEKNTRRVLTVHLANIKPMKGFYYRMN